MSAFHPTLPHGAGLLIISKEYYTWFIHHHACDERFVRMTKALGVDGVCGPMDFVNALAQLQKDCGVDNLKMADYGIQPSEFMSLAQNARATMGGLFACDRVPLNDQECAGIYSRSYQ